MNYKKITLGELADLNKLVGKKIVVTGQIVKSQTKKTKTGKVYCIVELEDGSQLRSFYFFGKDYESFCTILIEGKKIEMICNIFQGWGYEPSLRYLSISDGNLHLEMLGE